ncbi:MAG: hypothetical protein EP338_04960 [Bacteroidetes bacterium]|nr:MAG: hypothetical protein EP338_04960 [Bacteroidota bacterium]
MRLITSILCTLITVSIYAQQTPIEYMQSISGEFKKIQGATWDYTKSVAKNKGARKVNKNRLELVNTIQASLDQVNQAGAYDGKTYYRDSIKSFLEVNLAVVSEDYAKIMDLEDIAEQSYDMMDAYLTAKQVASEKLRVAGEKVDRAEKQFAEENNIKLIQTDDRVSLKLKKANKVYAYYNPIYLIFFKSYKQESYLMDALNKGDIAAMEQNKSSLSKFASDGLEELNQIEAFDNDASLKQACVDMLKFYQEEAEKDFNSLTEFYTNKEAFEKVKSKLDAKKGKNITQEEVDEYNKLVKEYNESTASFNETNQRLNNNRSKLINNWNNTAAKFTKKHATH